MPDQLMKFKITNDKLKMEISIKSLVWLFHNSPNNIDESGEQFFKVKRGKRREFAEWIVEQLQDEAERSSDGEVSWGVPFEDAFNKIFEGYELCDEFVVFKEDEEYD